MLLNIVCLANSYLNFETQSSFFILWRLLRLTPKAFEKGMSSFWIIFLFFWHEWLKTCIFSLSQPWNQPLLPEADFFYSRVVFRNQYLGAWCAYCSWSVITSKPSHRHMYIVYIICTNPHAHTCSYLILCVSVVY